MNEKENQPAEKKLICAKCNLPLAMGKVQISYMDSAFPVDILKCPQCGLVFVPEELALGKMVQVEKLLEDK